jgi:hypothetical protein
MRVITAIVGSDDADVLIRAADRYATTAKYAFGIITLKVYSGSIDIRFAVGILVLVLIDPILMAKILKLAAGAADTGKAVHAVI